MFFKYSLILLKSFLAKETNKISHYKRKLEKEIKLDEEFDEINKEFRELLFTSNFFVEEMRERLFQKYKEGYTGWDKLNTPEKIIDIVDRLYQVCIIAVGLTRGDYDEYSKKMLTKKLTDMSYIAMFLYDNLEKGN